MSAIRLRSVLAFALLIALAGVASSPAQEAPPAGAPVATDASLDADADGVSDLTDPCLRTGTGNRQVVPGCSAIQVAARPATLLGPLADARAHLDRSLETMKIGRFGSARRRAGAAGDAFAISTTRLAAGDPCAASGSAARALDALTRTDAAVRDDVRRYERKVMARRPSGGDADERDLLVTAAQDRARASAAARRRAAVVAGFIRTLCRRAASQSRTITGRVKALDSEAGIALLDNGTRVLLPGPSESSTVSLGLETRFRGVTIDGLGFLASAAAPPSVKIAQTTSGCVRLAVKPVQLPNSDVLHPSEGYMAGSALVLERGARLGIAKGAACAPHPQQGSAYSYDLSISLQYRQRETFATKKAWLGTAILPTTSVPLPDDIADGRHLLTVKEIRTTCGVVGDVWACTAPEQIGKQTVALEVLPDDLLGKVDYAQRVFALAPNEWGSTTFSYALPPGTPLAGTQHRAVGFGYRVGGTSDIFAFEAGQAFAVPDASDVAQAPDESEGIRTGLRAARLEGVRNGAPFWYSLAVDEVVTDAACLCPDTDARYRFPWTAGTRRKVTQGNNNPKFTHKDGQKYAFDFDHPMGTQIRAARGGEVIEVKEGYTATSDPKKCEADEKVCRRGNLLRVRHMDGQISVYIHMRHNGVLPEEGDWVRRGELVAYSGNTGNSTGPHLHFHVVTTHAEKSTIMTRFHLPGFAGAPDACFVPITGDTMTSNNA